MLACPGGGDGDINKIGLLWEYLAVVLTFFVAKYAMRLIEISTLYLVPFVVDIQC